jgi:hypothetical protein
MITSSCACALLISCCRWRSTPRRTEENGSSEEKPASLASRSSGLKQRPYSMQVSEVNSGGSEVQQVCSSLPPLTPSESADSSAVIR